MKLPSLIVLVLAIGAGVAFGVFIVPSSHALFSSASHPVPTASSTSVAGAGATGSAAPSVPGISTNTPAAGDLDTILANTDPTERSTQLQAFAQNVPAEKIADAVTDLSLKAPSDESQNAISVLINRWVKIDPDGARASISAATDPRVQYMLTHGVFTALGASDPANALQLAQQLSPEPLRDLAESAVVQEAAKQDPATALKLYNQAHISGPALGAIFMEWGDRDLKGATTALLALPHGDDRINVVRFMAHRLSQKDPAAALTWLDGLPPECSDAMSRQMLVGAWAARDPHAASQYVTSAKDALPPDQYGAIAYALAAGWSQTDPKAVATWAQSLSGDDQRNAMQIALASWGRTDPKSAAAFVATASIDDLARSEAAGALTSAWMKSDPQAAMNWVNTLPADTGVQSAALNAAMEEMARQDPAKASSYVANMPEGVTKMNAISRVVGSWMKDDPAATAQWVMSLPDSQVKINSLAMVASNWAYSDPEKASAWLSQLPPGTNRDNAAAALSNTILRRDPNSALQWANSISDPDARQSQVIALYHHWLQLDPAKAQAAMQSSSLTDDQKNEIIDNP